jgi:hypothetical protein
LGKQIMEWDDQSGLSVEDSMMNTAILPGDGVVCMEVDILPAHYTQTVQCVYEEYVSDNTYGVSECGKTNMERSAQPVKMIHTVQSGAEESNVSRLSECDNISMEMVQSSPDALETNSNLNTPSKNNHLLSSFFEISTDSQKKIRRAVPNTTKRKPIIKRGAFEKNHQVGFKMEKITKTFLNKPSSGVKRKIELFESLSTGGASNIEKHRKLSRMDPDLNCPDRDVANCSN